MTAGESTGVGRLALGALEGVRAALPPELRDTVDLAVRRLTGDYDEDEWGFDEGFADAVDPLLRFLYERWWRVEAVGVERVPSHGPVLLVANHAGVLPWDATMIATALLEEHPLPRRPRFLVLDWAFELPFVSVLMRKVGGVPASPYNALRLLEQGELVMVFPEGGKGTGKPFSQRYQLERFGRGGFVELALRAGAPIVPCAVVGSEEIYPKVADLPALARLTGAPYMPVTPTFPLLGPLGFIPLPSRWRIEFGDPIDVGAYGADGEVERGLVLEISEAIRDQIQAMVYEGIVRRRGAFL
jgi:1-acyl-sn-glycerol-3-phosphate acyltransferase